MSLQPEVKVVPWFGLPDDDRGFTAMVQVTDLDNRQADLLVTAVRSGDPKRSVKVNNSAGLRIPLASFGWLEYDASGRPGTWRLPT